MAIIAETGTYEVGIYQNENQQYHLIPRDTKTNTVLFYHKGVN